MAEAEKNATHPATFRNSAKEIIRFVMPDGSEILPKNKEQADYMDSLLKGRPLYVVTGEAGTGKTFLAIAYAVHAENARRKAGKTKEKYVITLVRPALDSGEKMGFLPGTFMEKQDPYMQPFYDGLRKIFPGYDGKAKCTYAMGVARIEIEHFVLEIAPLAYMRGRNFENRTVILDEGQNTTPVQMKLLTTRLDQNSRMIICGDITQCDLPRGQESGLNDLKDVLEAMPESTCDDDMYEVIELKDVVRHPMVARLIKGYIAQKAKLEAADKAA